LRVSFFWGITCYLKRYSRGQYNFLQSTLIEALKILFILRTG